MVFLCNGCGVATREESDHRKQDNIEGSLLILLLIVLNSNSTLHHV